MVVFVFSNRFWLNNFIFFLMIHISFSLFLIHESTLPRSFTKGHYVNLPAVWCNGYISVWSFAVKLCVVLVHFTWCFIPVREPLQFVPSAKILKLRYFEMYLFYKTKLVDSTYTRRLPWENYKLYIWRYTEHF